VNRSAVSSVWITVPILRPFLPAFTGSAGDALCWQSELSSRRRSVAMRPSNRWLPFAARWGELPSYAMPEPLRRCAPGEFATLHP